MFLESYSQSSDLLLKIAVNPCCYGCKEKLGKQCDQS